MVERRLTWLARIVLLWGAAIFIKLVSLQVLHHQEYAGKARARQELAVEIAAPRGTVFDRTGHPLAMSVPTESVYVNPLKVPDLDFASFLLSHALNLDRVELYGAMKNAYDNRRGFLWIKRKIDYDEGRRLRDMHLEWIGIQKESQRHYPNGSLAAHVLGSVDFEEAGNAGIERSLDKDLRGTPGEMRLLTDVKRRGIESQWESEPRPGTSVTLTIDERLQFVAERELAAAVHAKSAVSGSLVIMDPSNGDVLALASYPTYDPNLPPRTGEAFKRLNHAVSVPFEPGSVFKVFNYSAAFETTNLTPDTPVNCHGGVIKLPGRVIHDSHGGLGILPAHVVFEKSSNVGAIEVGARVGQQNMYDFLRKFGFGQKTGFPLPAESGGKLRKLSRWGTTSLASVSIGQEVSVTTLQLAQGVSVVATGGYLVRPRLVLKKGDQVMPPSPRTRVLKADTAITMRQMMEGVVLHGTGTNAKLAGYAVGGKTGSAQIFDFATRHYTHTYNGSFVGIVPLNHPAFVMVVTLNGTHGTAGFGGAAAAPVFQKVAAEALRVLEVPKDVPDEPPTLVTQVADVNDLAISDGAEVANVLDDSEDGEDDAPGQPVEVIAAGPRVPDFRGKTMSAVLAEATAKGFTIVPDGSGLARAQQPAAGAVLRNGQSVRVRFAR